MRILQKLPVFFLLLFVIDAALAQSDTAVYYLKARNGMNAVIKPQLEAINAEITFYIKTGSDYELDSVNGAANILQHFFSNKITHFLNSRRDSASFRNTEFRGYTTSDHTIFKFNIPDLHIAPCLELVKQYVFIDTMLETDLEPIRDSVLQEIAMAKTDPSKVFEEKMLRSIYKKDYQKMNPLGDSSKVENISYEVVNAYYEKYYHPDNTIITVTGNFNHSTFDFDFRNTFDTLLRNVFPFEGIMNINDFRPLIYSSQFVVEDSTFAPEFNICWQFPGTNSNIKASFSAHLLAAMLNDPNNFIQIKAAKMGCKKLVAQYEAGNFTSILRIILQPDTANFFSTYQFVTKELMRLEKTIVNESMLNAGKILFKKNYELLKSSKEFPEKVVHHTPYKDNRYYTLLIDSVLMVREKGLNSLVLNYMTHVPNVTGLKISPQLRQSLKIDSFFSNVDDQVPEYVFTYLQNVTDVEGADNLTKQNNLLQWLQANNDVYVQVNGYYDESEYDKARDESVMSFIDSIPTFRKRVTDLLQLGYFSPAMMRSLKIIRFLYQNGIAAERLSGTGMKFHSEDEAEKNDNMKCTLTVNKLRRNITTRELYLRNSNFKPR